MSQPLRAAEFFAGIGLMRAGLEKAGWTVCFANDIDPIKQKLYQHHFQDGESHFSLGDIHHLSSSEIPDIELATASFPCTDLSLAGKRAGLNGQHSSAFWGFIRVLKEMGSKRPPLVLLENVAGFFEFEWGEDLAQSLRALNELGYSVDAMIIDASHFVPQSRVRFFIVGKMKRDFQSTENSLLPASEIRPPKLQDFILRHPDIIWNLRMDLPQLPERSYNLDHIISHTEKKSSEWWSQDRVDYLLNQVSSKHLELLMGLREQNHYTYLTAFRRVRNGRSMAEIRFDGIAGCLRTPKGGSARQILLEAGKGEINVRLLSPGECGKLMGADDFRLTGSTHEALFGFGDAVVVPVVTWIAEHYLNPELKQLKSASNLHPFYAKTA